MTDQYPEDVPEDEQPPRTVENIPDDVLERALSYSVTYERCSECGTEQFFPIHQDRAISWPCENCSAELTIVGWR